MTKNKLLTKEEAAVEQRHHVMITDLCNSDCIFCLATEWNKRFCHFPADEVKRKIDEGIRLGAKRLILSGGEPTIHPKFIDFIKYGKKAGYEKIQVVSNGKMFFYKGFLNKAVGAGLGEITFSLPSHLEKDFEKQTGIKGSFRQSIGGLVNALKSEKLIVSVDIVINKNNYRRLHETMGTFIDLGVSEFDLLQVVPFGSAWKNRKKVFYDLEKADKELKKAFSFSKKRGLYVWTNRFPVKHLEYFENLIQDVHKLYDEIRGRREMFDNFTKRDMTPFCYGQRCGHCFLKNLCKELVGLKSDIDGKKIKALEIDLSSGFEKIKSARKASGRFPVEKISVRSPGIKELLEFVEYFRIDGRTELRLKMDDWAGLKEKLGVLGTIFSRIVLILESAGEIRKMFGVEADIEMLINKRTEKYLIKNFKELAESGKKIILSGENYDLLSDSLEKGTDFRLFFRALGKPMGKIKVRNIPRCLCAGFVLEPDMDSIDIDVFDKKGLIDMDGFVRFYILKKYYSKSLRCKKCRFKGSCRGLHINYIRRFGFGSLKPL